jgi:hypothetical protein
VRFAGTTDELFLYAEEMTMANSGVIGRSGRSVMQLREFAAVAALASAAAWSTPSWSVNYQMINLVSANHALSDMTAGNTYQGPGDYAALDGIPYRIGAPNVDGFNIWHSAAYPNTALTQTYELPVNVFGVTEVYTVMNIWWGVQDYQVATVEFFGSSGATHSKTLVVGEDIRDHAIPGFVGTINGTSTKEIFANGEVRLDRQQFVLPGTFSGQTLEKIVVTNLTQPPDTQGLGQAFLVGVTVAAVPEPQSYTMLLAGLGILGWRLQKRRS